MTIQGARDELLNMMECKDIPFYFKPILKEVVHTIEDEFATVCDISQIRAEIEQYEVECMLILPMTEQTCNRCTNDTFKNIYQIIDKYTK